MTTAGAAGRGVALRAGWAWAMRTRQTVLEVRRYRPPSVTFTRPPKRLRLPLGRRISQGHHPSGELRQRMVVEDVREIVGDNTLLGRLLPDLQDVAAILGQFIGEGHAVVRWRPLARHRHVAPPISPASERVWWGAGKGRVVTNAVRLPVRPATLWIRVVSMASARVIAAGCGESASQHRFARPWRSQEEEVMVSTARIRFRLALGWWGIHSVRMPSFHLGAVPWQVPEPRHSAASWALARRPLPTIASSPRPSRRRGSSSRALTFGGPTSGVEGRVD